MSVIANDGREYVVIPGWDDEDCIVICGNVVFYISICGEVIKTLGRELFIQKNFSRVDVYENLNWHEKAFYNSLFREAKINRAKEKSYENLIDAITIIALSHEETDVKKSQVFSILTGKNVKFTDKKLYMENQEVMFDAICSRAMKAICKEQNENMINRKEFFTKVVGVTQEKNRQLYVSRCFVGQKLELIRERTNPYDSNAIAVYAGNHQLGYIKKKIAGQLAEQIDSGKSYLCYVETVTGGEDMFWGVNIKIIEC